MARPRAPFTHCTDCGSTFGWERELDTVRYHSNGRCGTCAHKHRKTLHSKVTPEQVEFTRQTLAKYLERRRARGASRYGIPTRGEEDQWAREINASRHKETA